MPLDAVVRGVGSGTGAEVDANSQLKVVLPTVAANAGYTRILDSAGAQLLTTEDNYLNVSMDTMLFFEQVDGTAVNINTWDQRLTGAMTIDQTTGFIRLNASAITTVSTAAQISSIKQIPFYGTKPVKLSMNVKLNVAAQVNSTTEFGFGTVTGTATPTDGAFFRYTTTGTFVAVMNNNGTETTSANLTSPALNDSALYEIVVVEDLIQFLIDDVIVATITDPIGNAYPFNNGHQPIFFRTYTAGSAPAVAVVPQIGQVVCYQQDLNQNKLWKEVISAVGRGSYQSPVTAFSQTANYANSAAPASATLSNTAAGYTTLGGQWQFAAVAGAETDYALFAFTVPAGFQLYVTGLSVSAMNTVVAVGTTATVLQWSVAVNSSAASLATADGAATWAPRRIALGLQSFPVAAAVGAATTDLVRAFDPPLTVDSGRTFHIILKVPVGTATATEIFRGTATVTGYFE